MKQDIVNIIKKSLAERSISSILVEKDIYAKITGSRIRIVDTVSGVEYTIVENLENFRHRESTCIWLGYPTENPKFGSAIKLVLNAWLEFAGAEGCSCIKCGGGKMAIVDDDTLNSVVPKSGGQFFPIGHYLSDYIDMAPMPKLVGNKHYATPLALP